jgi:hypothetical protein
MVGRVSETARATQWTCAAACTLAADRIDAPNDTEIKPRTYENAGSESTYNQSHLYLLRIAYCKTAS